MESKKKKPVKVVFRKSLAIESNEKENKIMQKNQAYNSPLSFESFIPWVCLQWCVTKLVTVIRIDNTTGPTKAESTSSYNTDSAVIENHKDKPIEVQAYYLKSNLDEVAIINCHCDIPEKVIRAIHLCIPFHPTLSRLTFRRGGVTGSIVYEISKLLPHSNVTSVCLDDSYVREGNYDVLLQVASNLTYLSLSRCNINDENVERIAMSLVAGRPAAKCLRALELSTNNITDDGVQSLATMLRSNRTLMHLNLADNHISDKGATALINTLQEFCLTKDESYMVKLKYLTYLRKKQEVYNSCYKELNIQSKRKTKKGTPTEVTSKMEMANKLTIERIGEFVDPHSRKNVVIRDGCYHCKGNFILCSLNLGYNNLNFLFLPLLRDALLYQKHMVTLPDTGLIRIVLNGNNLPRSSCSELQQIENLLKEKGGSTTISKHTTKKSTASPIKRNSLAQSALHRKN